MWVCVCVRVLERELKQIAYMHEHKGETERGIKTNTGA